MMRSQLWVVAALVLVTSSACGLLESSSCDAHGDPVDVFAQLDESAKEIDVSAVVPVERSGECASANANVTSPSDDEVFIDADITCVGDRSAEVAARRDRSAWEGFTDGEQHDERAAALEDAMSDLGFDGVDVRCSDAETTCRGWAYVDEWVVELQTLNFGAIASYPARIDREDEFFELVAREIAALLVGSDEVRH